MSEMTKLVGNANTKSAGDFVLQGQKMGSESGFNHVNASWLAGTLSYEKGLELLEKDKAKTHDVLQDLNHISLGVNGRDQFVVKIGDGEFRPTLHAINQMASWGKTGSWLPQALMQHTLDEDEEVVLMRDKQDAETLVNIFQNGFRRLEQDKKFLWRLREDGTMRAMLSEIYARIDNRWYIELMQQIIPSGRLSHWQTDADTIWGNVLIPDTLRKEEDSDYGGMLSIGNSEIGERRISSYPSIYRAICFNGNVWGQTKGVAIKQVHRGSINLEVLAKNIAESVHKQLDILTPGIELLLKTKSIGWKGVTAKPVVAALASKHKLSKKQATEVLKAYNVEIGQTPELANTLFSLTNSVTRAGQKFDPATWFNFDCLGGTLMEYSHSDFDKLINIAKSMKEKEVEEMFVMVV